jgi:hypothetical protein
MTGEPVEISLVTQLVEVCQPLRHAVEMRHAADREKVLRTACSSLDALVARWRSKHSNLEHVVHAIVHRRDGIQALLGLSPEDPQSETKIYQQYLSLEDIPSQITSALEQSCLERGLVPSRYDLLNRLVELIPAKSYLEIGCRTDECFHAVSCSQKVGVDPSSGGTLRMTSDAFFEANVQVFDLIFIDGLHESWQVDRDIENALRWSSPHALIVLHDCNPLFEVRALVPQVAETWNGDVWKSLVRIRSRKDLDCATGLFDHGCAVICKRPNSAPIDMVPESALSWDNLTTHRESWIRPMSYDDLLAWIQGSR